MDLQEKAKLARSWLVQKKREDGTPFYCSKDNAPEWVADMCHEAHGQMLPDDWRYSFIVESLDALAESEDADDAYSQLDADIRNADILDWVGSHGYRIGYVDDAVGEYGHGDSVIDDIMRGQLTEKYEVFNSVREFLDELDLEDGAA